MIKQIAIKNYKSFRDYNEIEIRPITILVGPNSSGKSTLLKLLAEFTPKYVSYYIHRLNIEDINFEKSTYLKNKKPIEIVLGYDYFGIDFNSRYKIRQNNFTVNTKIFQSIIVNSLSYCKSNSKFSLKYKNGIYIIYNWDKIYKKSKNNLEKLYDEEITEINKLFNLINIKRNNTFYDIGIKILQNILKHGSNFGYNGNPFFIDINDRTYVEASINLLKKIKLENIKKQEIDELLKGYVPLPTMIRELYENNNPENYKKNKENIKNIIRLIKKENNYDVDKLIKVIELICKILFINQMEIEILLAESEFISYIKDSYGLVGREVVPRVISIKPLRAFPKNYYSIKELKEIFLISSDLIIAKNFLTIFTDEINNYISMLDLKYKLNIKTLNNKELDEPLFVIKFKDVVTNAEYNLNEIGFGFSQILPIISNIVINSKLAYIYDIHRLNEVEIFKNNIYLIEQPELHLHPLQQTKLANLFYEIVFNNEHINEKKPALLLNDQLFDLEVEDQLKKRLNEIIIQDNYNNNVNHDINNASFIIETHSEHLIRGLQLLVAQRKIQPEHLGIYFISKNKEGVSTIKKMEVSDNGLFKEAWPEGFFDQHYKLAKELLFAGNKQ